MSPTVAAPLRTGTVVVVLGLADILLVLATGVRLGLRDPAAVDGFVRMPLVLLPTFLVPLVLATHVLLFGRLRGGGRRAAA